MEARVGIEPTRSGFAVRGITTLLPGHKIRIKLNTPNCDILQVFIANLIEILHNMTLY